MNSALRAGIYTLGKTVTGLSASNLFFDKARQGTSKPYVTFNSIANPYTRDSAMIFETDFIQFSIYAASMSAAETLMAAITTIFDDCEGSLTVAGYNVITVDRISRPVYLNDMNTSRDKNNWFIAIEYRIETSKSRS